MKLQVGDFSGALADLDSAAHADPHHALAWALGGFAYLSAGDPARAEERLHEACKLEPAVPIFRAWRAKALHRLGREKEAFALVDAVVAEGGRPWWALQLRARFQLELGRPKAALEDARRALASEGRHAETHALHARVLLALGRKRDALESVEKALSVSPNLARAYVLRAQIRAALGRHEDAVEDYRTVLEKYPFLLNADEAGRVRELVATGRPR